MEAVIAVRILTVYNVTLGSALIVEMGTRTRKDKKSVSTSTAQYMIRIAKIVIIVFSVIAVYKATMSIKMEDV